MKSKTYLYGEHLLPIIAQEVIDARIAILTIELRNELSNSLDTRNHARVTDLVKAKEFWRKINE